MRVIRAAAQDRDQQVLDQFKDHLIREDHAPATIRAYLSDLGVFKQWLSWIFEGQPASLAQVQTAELTAFRKYLIHQKNRRPATVNRRVQSLRTFYGFLARQGLINEDPARRLRYVRRGMRTRPRTLRASPRGRCRTVPRPLASAVLRLRRGVLCRDYGFHGGGSG